MREMESQAFYWFWDQEEKKNSKPKGRGGRRLSNRGRWQEPKSPLLELSGSFVFIFKDEGGGPGEGLGF